LRTPVDIPTLQAKVDSYVEPVLTTPTWAKKYYSLFTHQLGSLNPQGTKSFYVTSQIETLDERKTIFTNLLLDTGASGIFVDEEWAKRQNFNFILIDCPIPVRNADGTLNSGGYIKNRIEFILRVGTHQERISADVTNLGGKQKLILGLPWLEEHNPEIDWNQRSIKFSRCRNCTKHDYQTRSTTIAYMQEQEQIFVKKESETAKTLTRSTWGAAGFDLYADETTSIPAHGRALVSTGIAIALPEGTYGRIAPRSSLAVKYSIDTGAGVIDEDYRGIVKILLVNHSDTPLAVKPGERMAQLIVERISLAPMVEVDTLSETKRGESGFGSTGICRVTVETIKDLEAPTLNPTNPRLGKIITDTCVYEQPWLDASNESTIATVRNSLQKINEEERLHKQQQYLNHTFYWMLIDDGDIANTEDSHVRVSTNDAGTDGDPMEMMKQYVLEEYWE
jgi:dUTP pyrophosphatase